MRAYAFGLLAGGALFFCTFSAVFTGAWWLLLLFVGGYAAAGAAGTRVGEISPPIMATVLTLPAIPWLLWLFPASVAEAGLARALLWPAIAGLMWALAWLGAWLASRRAAPQRNR